MCYCQLVSSLLPLKKAYLHTSLQSLIITLIKLSPPLTWMLVQQQVLKIVFYDWEQVQLSSYSIFSQFVGPASVIFVCCNVSVCAGILFTIFISPSPQTRRQGAALFCTIRYLSDDGECKAAVFVALTEYKIFFSMHLPWEWCTLHPAWFQYLELSGYFCFNENKYKV